MEWHVNDLSLCGQFPDPQAFRAALEPLLRLRRIRPDLRARIFCSRSLHLRPVTAVADLREAILGTRDKLFIGLALEWFANGGPFWEDERAGNPDDYFEFEGEDVTDQGLGEATRRLVSGGAAGSFSFYHSPATRFCRTPLSIQHGLTEEVLGLYELYNCWTVDSIREASFTAPSNWGDVLVVATNDMDLLRISPTVIDQLRPSPFHVGVAARLLDLLRVLQKLAEQTRDDGAMTPAGMELLQTFFVGEKASFTDESEGNKQKFKADLTFRDPEDTTRRVFCPWHGKVKIGQFRIHFEWPRPIGQRVIKVMYMGPKITKH